MSASAASGGTPVTPGTGKPSEPVCLFCNRTGPLDSSLDGQLIEAELTATDFAWVHYACATWTPEVSVDDDGTFRGIEKGFKRGRKLRCSHCKLYGAPVGCWSSKCKDTFHYVCLQPHGCLQVEQTYVVLCPEHKDEAPAIAAAIAAALSAEAEAAEKSRTPSAAASAPVSVSAPASASASASAAAPAPAATPSAAPVSTPTRKSAPATPPLSSSAIGKRRRDSTPPPPPASRRSARGSSPRPRPASPAPVSTGPAPDARRGLSPGALAAIAAVEAAERRERLRSTRRDAQPLARTDDRRPQAKDAGPVVGSRSASATASRPKRHAADRRPALEDRRSGARARPARRDSGRVRRPVSYREADSDEDEDDDDAGDSTDDEDEDLSDV